jgi:hypothetical protein
VCIAKAGSQATCITTPGATQVMDDPMLVAHVAVPNVFYFILFFPFVFSFISVVSC